MPELPLLELRSVTKRYGGVTALEKVDFACHEGSIHAILGENGAGKSTLIKTIAGVVQPSEGELFLRGEPVRFEHPVQATQAGIACVFQELSLMPNLTVAENISIGLSSGRWGMRDRKAQTSLAERLLARVGSDDIDPLEWVGDLTLSQRQIVELAKALGRNPKLLILDEATSALTSTDVDKVFKLLKQLREEGLSLLYISHRMNEIKQLADTLSVFRNGRHIETFAKGKHSDEDIVQLMIGRDVGQVFPPAPPAVERREPVLEVRGLNWEDELHDVSFTLGRGEILGVGGLDGQGQKELLLALFGVLRGTTGSVRVRGREATLRGPHAAKSDQLSMALVPEDRKTQGLMLPMSIGDNISLAALSSFTQGGRVDVRREREAIKEMLQRLEIKIGDISDPVNSLSGGNQQKVVLAKWLMTQPGILMLNDPTRGIDVGTKQQLYNLFRELAAGGTSILLYTTDYDELVGLCDRAMIFYQGHIIRELVGDELTETNIVASSFNIAGTDSSGRTGVPREAASAAEGGGAQ